MNFKGTVILILRNPTCKDGNARFTKLCLIKYWLYIRVFVCFKLFIFSAKVSEHFLFIRKTGKFHRKTILSSTVEQIKVSRVDCKSDIAISALLSLLASNILTGNWMNFENYQCQIVFIVYYLFSIYIFQAAKYKSTNQTINCTRYTNSIQVRLKTLQCVPKKKFHEQLTVELRINGGLWNNLRQ